MSLWPQSDEILSKVGIESGALIKSYTQGTCVVVLVYQCFALVHGSFISTIFLRNEVDKL